MSTCESSSPNALHFLTTSCRVSTFRPVRVSLEPCFAKSSAIPSIPLLEPVIYVKYNIPYLTLFIGLQIRRYVHKYTISDARLLILKGH